MEKKQYEKPEVAIIHVEPESMMAASGEMDTIQNEELENGGNIDWD